MILRTVIRPLSTLNDICTQAEVSQLWISLQRTPSLVDKY